VQGLFKAGEKLLGPFGHAGGTLPSPSATLPAVLRFSQLQGRYCQQQFALGMSIMGSVLGNGGEPVVTSEPGDRRFHGKDWRENAWSDLLKQSYLLNSQLLAEWIDAADLNEKEGHKVGDSLRGSSSTR